MSDPIPAAPGNGPVPPQLGPQPAPLPAGQPEAPPPPLAQTAIRLGYRMTGGKSYSHGIQLLGGPTFRLNDNFKIWLGVEVNNMFAFSDAPPSEPAKDAVIGQHFGGVRGATYDGVTYTDAKGGTQFANKAYFMEVIPETHFIMKPVATLPIEIILRLGGALTYTTTHTKTTIHGATTGNHQGGGDTGCIPGDIYCKDSPTPAPNLIPTDTEVPEVDSSQLAFWVRFGLRFNFPVSKYFQFGTEGLLQSNPTTYKLEPLWRTNIRGILPIGDTFQFIAEPRYVMRNVTDKGKEGITHGFDFFAGGQVRF